MPLPNYPAPGAANSKADGISIRFTGDDTVVSYLKQMGNYTTVRLLGALEAAGRDIASSASANTSTGKPGRGRRPGRLKGSFQVEQRKGWLKWGLLGVAVRSRAKYHHYQEFGVNRPNTQVLIYRKADGSKVRRGQGIDADHGRFALGTNRLNPGVRVRSYRRDIIIPAQTMLGRAVASNRSVVQERLLRVVRGLMTKPIDVVRA